MFQQTIGTERNMTRGDRMMRTAKAHFTSIKKKKETGGCEQILIKNHLLND